MGKEIPIIDLENEDLSKVGSSKVVGVGDNLGPERVITYALDYGFGQIVQKSNPNKESEILASKLILDDRQRFLDFPLSSVLTPEKAGGDTEEELLILEYDFNNSSQKFSFLDSLQAKLEGITKSQSLIRDVCVVADELFTNAVYNASFVDIENALSGISRELPEVKMKVGHSGRITLGIHENRLALSCEDSLGALNLKKQLERIRECYEKGTSEVINLTGKGGARIGSFLIFKSSMSYYAVVDVGVKTSICCTFPLRMSNKKRTGLPKNLHVL